MKAQNLLIVSPVFPPANAPEMHRVRMSLRYYREFGWKPRVLAVEPARTERIIDPVLRETVPHDAPVHFASAFDPKWTRKIGFSAIGLRAWPFLYRQGAKLIRENRPDLVYFSTTAF